MSASVVRTVDAVCLDAVLDRAARDVRDGILPAASVAVARDGSVAGTAAFGAATFGGEVREVAPDDLFHMFSATKAVVSSGVWLLMGEGLLDVGMRIATLIPEFGANGKDEITLEQVLLHVGGFPYAVYPPEEWDEPDAMLARFASWTLEWTPGTRYEYHATSAHWVVAAVIERVAGCPWQVLLRQKILDPLCLAGVRIGLPFELAGFVADVEYRNEPPGLDELAAAGIAELPPVGAVTEEAILALNEPASRCAGLPGGGGVATAADLASFHQAVIADLEGAGRVWRQEALADALRPRPGYTDPWLGVPVNRALGVVIAGDDGLSHLRGFGRTVGPRAFGHNGAGGQVGWGDPDSGVSLGYLTPGFDRNVLREWRRSSSLGSRAGACGERRR